jgi:hypothetical protein
MNNDDSSKTSQPKTWVTLLVSLIGALAIVFAAVIGVDAKHDSVAANSLLAEKDAEIQELQKKLLSCAPPEESRAAHGQQQSTSLPDKEESTSNAPITPKNYTRDSNGFRFSFSGSSFTDRKLKLNIIVVSQGQDRKLWIHHKTRLIADTGQVYNPSRTTLGTEEQTFGGMAYDCPANVPVTMTIEFDNINAGVRRFELLEVDHQEFKVKYSGDDLFSQPPPNS